MILLCLLFAAEPSSQPSSQPATFEVPAGAVALERVSVLGTPIEQARLTGAAYAIDENKLKTFGHTDVHRILGEAPGVYVREEDGFGLRPNIGLRGASSDRSSKVALLEDGILLAPAPYAAPAAYYFPMMLRITGVEVFKGPAAIKYGPQTVGGAINMLTRFVPRKPTYGIDFAAGMYGTVNTHAYVGLGNDVFGALLEGAYQHSDGFKKLPDHQRTGFDRGELMLKLSGNTPLTGDIAHQWDVKASISYELSNETYLGLSDEDFAKDPYQRYAASRDDLMRSWRTQVQASYLLIAGEMWEFSLKAYRHDQSRQWTKLNGILGAPLLNSVFASPDGVQSQRYLSVLRGEIDSTETERVLIGTNDRRFIAQGVQATLTAHPVVGPVKQDIELSLRFHHDQVDRVHDDYPHDMVNGTPVRIDGHRINADNLAQALAFATYLQDQLQWKRLLIVPGIRLEYIRANYADRLDGTFARADTVAVLPGIGVYYGIVEEFGVLAGVHRGFSPKAPGQSGTVEPEYSVNYEAGVRAKWKTFDAEAIAFLSDYSNLTGECTFSSGCAEFQVNQQFNGGTALVYGVEAAVKYSHRFAHELELRGQASYTLTMSQFMSEFSSSNPQWGTVKIGDSLPYVPEHQASVTIGIGMEKWGLDATVKIVGAMRDLPGQGEIPAAQKIPAYAVADLAAFYVLPGGLRVTTTLENFTNTVYMVSRRPFGARPGKPITFLAGLRYAF